MLVRTPTFTKTTARQALDLVLRRDNRSRRYPGRPGVPGGRGFDRVVAFRVKVDSTHHLYTPHPLEYHRLRTRQRQTMPVQGGARGMDLAHNAAVLVLASFIPSFLDETINTFKRLSLKHEFAKPLHQRT